MAHPHTLGLRGRELDVELRKLAAAGLRGVECFYPEYDPETRLELVERSRDVGLVPSGGSDYHGTYKPGIELGRGYGDLLVEAAVLEELRLARP